MVAGRFGIIIEAFIVHGADLFLLGQTFVLVGSVITGLITLWLFASTRPLRSCRAASCRWARNRQAESFQFSPIFAVRASSVAVLTPLDEAIIHMRDTAKDLML